MVSTRPEPLRAALAQTNPTVGDIEGNARRIDELIAEARGQGAQLVVFGELALTGYPPEDLLLKTHFLQATRSALEELAAGTQGIVALVGFPEHSEDVYNAAAVLADGAIAGIYRKMHLPNYGVFDESRYFQSGSRPATFELNGVTIGLTICEDIWEPGPPATTEVLAGAEVVVNLSASPYHAGKGAERERMLIQRAHDNLTSILFTNIVGGQDELVFDGHSLAIDQDGACDRAGPPVRGVAHHMHRRPGRGGRRSPARPPPPRSRARGARGDGHRGGRAPRAHRRGSRGSRRRPGVGGPAP